MHKKIPVCGLTADELTSIISPSGYTLRHSLAITNFLYKCKGADFSAITGVPGSLKLFLKENTVSGTYPPSEQVRSSDGTIKYLFRNEEGLEFETVYIPDSKRHTVCVSTQSGCRMGCYLCATGKYGFYGNLSAGDIVNQVISLPDCKSVTHIVFMGMGEPMDNIENVLKACSIMTAEWGMSKSPRNITVSTVGIMPGIQKFLEGSFCNLTLSLFSPFPAERGRFIGVEKKYPAADILELISSFPISKKRRISVAYVMIKDFNDTDEHLDALKMMLAGQTVRINLLPYHESGDDVYHSSPQQRIQLFRHELMMAGISASVRKSRGMDISAACGLLASQLKRKQV